MELEKMSEQDYRKAKGINYSSMSQFWISQDHALLPFKHKSYFEIGKMFETLLQDSCIGTTDFESKYFICEVAGKMPDDLISLIESGADLEQEFVLTLKGERNKARKVKHAYLDACLEHKKGLFPVPMWMNDMLLKLVDNMLKMELLGATVFDILSKAEWQVPIFWEKNGIKKKALLDCVLPMEDATFVFDVKTAQNEFQFSQMAQKKYWVQRDHYTEGCNEVYGNVECFTFLNAYKEKPYLCEPVNIEGDRGFEYDKLCRDFVQWLKDGRPAKGFLPERKVYLRNL